MYCIILVSPVISMMVFCIGVYESVLFLYCILYLPEMYFDSSFITLQYCIFTTSLVNTKLYNCKFKFNL